MSQPMSKAASRPQAPVVFHFVEDGFTASGSTWYTGDEVEYVPDSTAAKMTEDRRGFTWLYMLDNPEAQIKRWGKVYMKPGPYRGPKFVDMDDRQLRKVCLSGNPLAPLTRDQAERSDAERRKPLPTIHAE